MITRRDFLQLSAILGLSVTVGGRELFAGVDVNKITMDNLLYDNFKPQGQVTLLHMCDLHAHLKPLYWREPSTLLSGEGLVGTPGFLCGEAFSKFYNVQKNSIDQYFGSYVDFESLAKKFGKMGGVAHIKTVLDKIRKERGEDKCLFLDSGDTWQGTGLALKTGGEAIVEAQNRLGVDVMVGHWEFTYGGEQVQKLAGNKDEKGLLKADFIAQNIVDEEWRELIYNPYVIKERNGVKIGFLGQAFPYTKTANPKNVDGWSYGLNLETMQQFVNELKTKADIVVLLSHDGYSVDQEVARKVNGIDIILSGHTHDPAPKPIKINNTLIIISGSHGKYVSRLDLTIKDKRVADYSYKLIPIASNIIPADKEMEKWVESVYEPFKKELNQIIGKTDSLLYKRDTFFSTFDQLINEAIVAEMGSDISFTPAYRWGATLLGGDNITVDDVYDFTAITYPEVYTFELKGSSIPPLLEDIADNVLNPNPLYQQGGDMSRTYGLSYDMRIKGKSGARISNMKVNGKTFDPNKTYLVSSWGGNLQKAGTNLREKNIRPVYDVVVDYIKAKKVVSVSNKSNVNIVDFPNHCPLV